MSAEAKETGYSVAANTMSNRWADPVEWIESVGDSPVITRRIFCERGL